MKNDIKSFKSGMSGKEIADRLNEKLQYLYIETWKDGEHD